MTNLQRASQYEEAAQSLREVLRHTSRKDSDVREEIKEDIADYERWIARLKKNPDSTDPNI